MSTYLQTGSTEQKHKKACQLWQAFLCSVSIIDYKIREIRRQADKSVI
jgi:hypothetical protein